MARYVMQAPVTVPAGANPYLQPARTLKRGDVVELNASEVTAIGAGNMRVTSATTATATRDQLGEAFAASNATP